MHNDLSLFVTITLGLVAALIGGLVARKLKLPAIAGYLLAGVVIGPATPGFVGDSNEIRQLAEMGVIFMMFGVGLHFSLKDLFSMRKIAVPGALLQMAFGTLMGFLLGQIWGWEPEAGLLLGFSISIASTVVLLRGLSDNGHLNTTPGKVATGWLILEDLATVAILVLMPTIFGEQGTGASSWISVGRAIAGVTIFVAIMLLVGAKLLPWLLSRVARTRSRELFILTVVALALGTALAAANLFGVSLALGAFLAGVVIRESEAGHQVGAELVPFRDIFSILFFVSVGMLVDPVAIIQDPAPVLILTAAIVGGKWVINMLIGLVLPTSMRTILVVAAGLSQIGEFSFILGQSGVYLGVFSEEQYALILAGAVLSIVLNPFVFKITPALERSLLKVSFIRRHSEKHLVEPEAMRQGLKDHVVVVGMGRIGSGVIRVLKQLDIPHLVVETDLDLASDLQRQGTTVLYGDAANSEIMLHMGLSEARAIVVTISDEVSGELIVAAAHQMAPELPVIARAATIDGVKQMLDHGAHHVVHPALEGGLEIIRHMLLDLGYAPDRIQRYSDEVRRHAYALSESNGRQPYALDQLVSASRSVEIQWLTVTPESVVCDTCLSETNIRARTGASVIALMRDGVTMPNPKSNIMFQAGDMIGVIGSPKELEAAAALISGSREV